MRTYIIAEACSNILPANNVRIDLYCEAAKEAGADAIKIQLFTASHFPLEEQEAKKKSEFPIDMLGYFANTCKKLALEWGASVFDGEAIGLLVEHKSDFIKLATREQNNNSLTYCAMMQGLPVFRSVDWRPGSFGRGPVDGTITLGCCPEYPAELGPIYLERLPKPYGWSSHSTHWNDVYYAVQKGASVIEKHFRLAGENSPEIGWSLEQKEFTRMVKMIRRMEDGLFSGERIDTEQSEETTTPRLECLLREAGRS